MLFAAVVNSLTGSNWPFNMAGNADLYSICTMSAKGSPVSTVAVNLGIYSSKGTFTNSILVLYFFSISSIFARRSFSEAEVPAGFKSHHAAILITRPSKLTASAAASSAAAGSGFALSCTLLFVLPPFPLLPPLHALSKNIKHNTKYEIFFMT
ncbi:hypothetical protein D3C80_1124600 [compost metagenome]